MILKNNRMKWEYYEINYFNNYIAVSFKGFTVLKSLEIELISPASGHPNVAFTLRWLSRYPH